MKIMIDYRKDPNTRCQDKHKLAVDVPTSKTFIHKLSRLTTTLNVAKSLSSISSPPIPTTRSSNPLCNARREAAKCAYRLVT